MLRIRDGEEIRVGRRRKRFSGSRQNGHSDEDRAAHHLDYIRAESRFIRELRV
jgi:hypothetical protein